MLYSIRFTDHTTEGIINEFLDSLGCKNKIINHEKDLKRILLHIDLKDQSEFVSKLNRNEYVQLAEQV